MEGFVDIIGYEGLYMINKEGDVYGCKNKRMMKHHISYKGYNYVHLTKNNEGHQYFIHRLIAIQFIPNPNKLDQVDHIDMDKKNNKIENLRWVNNALNQQNTLKRSNNQSGFKNIFTEQGKNGYEGWRITIRHDNKIYRKCYAKTKYTLDDIIKIRNEKYMEYGLKQYD